MVTTQITKAQAVAISEPGHYLRADAAAAWERVRAAFGKRALLTDSWRSYEVQEQIFRDRYRQGNHNGQPGFTTDVRTWNGVKWTRRAGTAAAAVPGTSNHGGGVAVDVRTSRRPTDPPYEEAVVFTSFSDPDRLAWLRVAAEHGWADDEGRSVNECLTGDTEIITYDGVQQLGELVGKKVKVLARKPKACKSAKGSGNDPHYGRWLEAEVHSFGKQAVFAIQLTRCGTYKTIKATGMHIWPVERSTSKTTYTENKHTLELIPGDELQVVVPKPDSFGKRKLSPFGIVHGAVCGDGSIRQSRPESGFIKLYGDKANLAQFFPPGMQVAEGISGSGCHWVEMRGVPRAYKSPPDLTEHGAYLAGWLAGYIATDGCVSGSGITLSSTNRDFLNTARTIAIRLGLVAGDLAAGSSGGFATPDSPICYTLRLSGGDLSWLLLRESHLSDYRSPEGRRLPGWKVVSVTPAGEAEVYCATVPEVEHFALQGNILTHNCWHMTYYPDRDQHKGQAQSNSVHPVNTTTQNPETITKAGGYTVQILDLTNADKTPVKGTGLWVKKLQGLLKAHGHYDGAIDGSGGAITKAGLLGFQKAKNLVPDAICGALTWDALIEQ